MLQTKEAATVHVVDDDAMLRGALGRALAVEGFHVRCWATADAFLAEYDPGQPGCLVTDVAMPGTDGLRLQSVLAQRDRALPVILMSGNADVRMSVQAMRAGAVTLLQKPVRLTELVQAITEGLQRNRVLRQQAESSLAAQSRLTALTPRERQVLDLVLVGKLNKQIAAQLGAAEKTIKVHRGRVMQKMKVRSVAELVTVAALAREGAPAM
jgi:FixJ family two-component response regulator